MTYVNSEVNSGLNSNLGFVQNFDRRLRVKVFAKARGHTRFVHCLRWLIIIASFSAIALGIIIVVFDPFAKPIAGVSFGPVSLNGTKITMEHPKLSGYRKDGRPYLVNAKTAVQDITTPSIVELNTLDSLLIMADKSEAHVFANKGVYDNTRDFMTMAGNIKVVSDSYTVYMKSADINMKTSHVVSKEPVRVDMKTGFVAAESMVVEDGGKQISFDGNVTSLFKSEEAAADTGKGESGKVGLGTGNDKQGP